jgi:molecular chaperone GrpE (heat shock protein)
VTTFLADLLEALDVPKCIYHEVRYSSEKEITTAILAICIHNHLKLKKISMNLDDLLAKVQAQKTVEDSIVSLLNHVSAELKAELSKETLDPAKIKAIADQLDANTQEIVDAVNANSPAASTSNAAVSESPAPTPVTEPTPEPTV